MEQKPGQGSNDFTSFVNQTSSGEESQQREEAPSVNPEDEVVVASQPPPIVPSVEQAQPTNEQTITNGNGCFVCKTIRDLTFCRHCGNDFCPQHSSKYNPTKYCQDCIFAEDMSLIHEPLVDEDGVRKQGFRIRLIGQGWPNEQRLIGEQREDGEYVMSDDELRLQIQGLQKLLQDAIGTADYARISIASREYELSYREHSRYVKAMKSRKAREAKGVITIGGKKRKANGGSKTANLPDPIQALMALGLTREQAEAMKAVLGAAVPPQLKKGGTK